MTTALFTLSEAQTNLLERARAVGRDALHPIAERGAPGRLNRQLVRALGEHELLPRLFPRSAGGLQEETVSALELCLLRQGLARVCVDAETALALQGLGAYPILQSGREEVVQRWLPAVARGEAVAAFALTEPGAGSDAAALALRAERDGSGWRLSGEKIYISNAPEADVYTVFARTTEGAGARGVSAFAVDGDSEGLSGEHLELLSNTHAIGHMHFDGVLVPEECLLGAPDRGFRVAMRTLDLFRPSVGAAAVGISEAALEAALVHSERRQVFGQPLRDLQTVSHRLAGMATRLEAARLLVYSAASGYDAGAGDVSRKAAMAKLFATETAHEIVDAAVQIHGAAALRKGHLLELLYREVRALRIYEGASEVQLEIIAKHLRVT